MKNDWRTIPNYENYLVNSDGDVFSKHTNKLLKLRKSKFGYMRAALYNSSGEKHEIMVHRLVALAFIENPLNLPQVNHKNEVKTDNRVENLEWCDCSYNINYGTRNSIVSKKQKENKDKTVARKVMQINPNTNEVIKVWNSLRDIERELGIPHSNIYYCCTGKRKTRGGFIWKYYDQKEGDPK